MPVKRKKRFYTPRGVKKIIKDALKETTEDFVQIFTNQVKTRAVAVAVREWNKAKAQLDETKMVKDGEIPDGNVLGSAFFLKVDQTGTAGTLAKISFWNPDALTSVTWPRGKGPKVPTWIMMNWGSGPNWDINNPYVPNLKGIKRKYGGFSRPLRTKASKKDSGFAQTKSKRISDKTKSEFSWLRTKPGTFGDQGVGFYLPTVRAKLIVNSALVGAGIAGVTSGVKVSGNLANAIVGTEEPMEYFIPSYFLEASINEANILIEAFKRGTRGKAKRRLFSLR